MKMIKTLGLTLAAAGMTAITAQAVPIVGSVGFTGSYTQTGGTIGDLSSATSMTIVGVVVTPFSPTGDFVGAGLPLTFFSPILVNGGVAGNVGIQLWSVTVGSDLYTFDVASVSQSFTSVSQINLIGTGTMERGGVDATAGTWQLGFGVSGTVPSASFTWQSTSAANVPDGGMTVAMLGLALSGLGLMRRKLVA